tara:strand:- start:10762 stop:13176 length:2415 start_codon:yes stop_codon:yes gene_type:complete
MKKRLSLFIIFLLSSFFFYINYNEKKSTSNLWDIVPSKSAIIIELDEPNFQWNKLLSEVNESKLKNSINTIINDYSLFNEFIDGRIQEYLEDNKVLISYFNLSNKILEPVYLSYKKNLDQNFIIEKLREKGYDLNQRNLNGEVIFEAKKNDINHIFSFLDNKIVHSSNSIIIEDIIRSINNSELLFKEMNPSLFSQVKIKNDFGNIYVNFSEIKKIITNVFPKELFSRYLKLLPEKSFFDVEITNDLVRMNGFSSEVKTNKSYNNSNYDSILNFMPSNTVFYINQSMSNSLNTAQTVSKALIESLNSNTFFEISVIKKPITTIKNEKEIDNGIYSFNDEKIFLAAQIDNKEDAFYYFNYNHFMLISKSYNSLIELNSLILENDFWSKNLNFNKFQKQLNESHNILMIFDISRLFPLKTNIGFASVQLNKIKDRFYMSMNLKEKNTDNFQIGENIINEFSFKNNISSKPHIIFSHIDNKPEVILQDEKNFIYHLSNSLKPIWSDSIEKIISKVFTIDYYKNNKKQILFASSDKIYGYDRKGNRLIGFPFENPSESPITHLNIIDYDKSKRYRIISSHDNGEIYFYDKSGNILKGWNPLSMNDNLVQAPIHKRVRGKDYIIIVLRDGNIYVKNRRGENYKGFPINLDSEISNKLYFKKSSSSSKSEIEILSDEGKLYNINLDGKILSLKDQYRNEKDSKFIMIHEASGKNPLLASYDNYNLFMDDNKINFNDINNLKFQYYHLNKKQKFLIVTDKKIKKSYFLNNNLNYFMDPISNQNEVSILDYGKSIIIYKTLNNNLSMIELKK